MPNQFSQLFKPGKIGNLTIKNRLLMAPMGSFSSENTGAPTRRMIDYYSARAAGGVGMVIVEATRVSHEARTTSNHLVLYNEQHVPLFKELATAIKANGARAAVQLAHLGAAKTKFWDYTQHERKSPLPIAVNAATQKDLARYVDSFAQATVKAREAGFEAVEYHAAHGAFLSCFLSPLTNRRQDEYGGSAERRARLVCEIVARARQEVGPDFPLIVRMNGSDFLPGGITLEDAIIQAVLFVKSGVTALHISASTTASHHWQFLPYYMKPGCLLPLASAIKKAVDVPVIAVGKVSNILPLADQALKEGKADFISLGRPLLADPDLVIKLQQGRAEDIRPCIYCNNCIGGAIRRHRELLQCTVNPTLVRERTFTIKPTKKPKSVLVAGGGLAGMEVARTLAERGHTVSLYEKSDKLGGQFGIACLQDTKKDDYSKLITYLTRGLDKAGVKVRLNTEVTVGLVKKERPDIVIVATGALPAPANVPGSNRPNVVQANDVITGKAKVGQRVVIIGGRHLGMELADDLARHGKTVSLVSRRVIGRDVERAVYVGLMDNLVKNRVCLYPNSLIHEINDKGAYIVYNRELLFLEADTVVLAMGAVAQTDLFDALKPVVHDLYVLGDCAEPRDALAAIHDAAEMGHAL